MSKLQCIRKPLESRCERTLIHKLESFKKSKKIFIKLTIKWRDSLLALNSKSDLTPIYLTKKECIQNSQNSGICWLFANNSILGVQ